MVHRLFYETIKGKRAEGPPPQVRPVVAADRVVTSGGVTLEFLERKRDWTPPELRMFARWIFSLAHEAEDLAKQGLISENQSYDVVDGRII